MAIEIKTNGKALTVDALKGQLVQGEHNTTEVTIELPANANGVELTGFTWQMRGTNCDSNTLAVAELTATEGTDKITLVWTVSNQFTSSPGEICLMLDGVKGDDVIRFKGEHLEIIENCNGHYAPSGDYLDQVIREMQEIRNEAVAAAQSVGQPPYIGENGNWFVWDRNTGQSVDSGEKAQGPKGDKGASGDGTGDMLASEYDAGNDVRIAGGIQAHGDGRYIQQSTGSVISTYTHAKSGTVHALTGSGDNIRFTAIADYATGDTFTVNGTVATFSGTPNFKTGDVVSCMLENSKLTFATVPNVMWVLKENGFKGDTLPTITSISSALENGFYACNGSSGTAGTPTNSWYIVQVIRHGSWVRIIARQGWEVQNTYEKYRSADGASDSGWYKYTLTKV